MSTFGQLKNMKRPQDASWNMVYINPQLVAVTAKLENIEAKLPSLFFFKLKLFKFKVVSTWDEWGGEKWGKL